MRRPHLRGNPAAEHARDGCRRWPRRHIRFRYCQDGDWRIGEEALCRHPFGLVTGLMARVGTGERRAEFHGEQGHCPLSRAGRPGLQQFSLHPLLTRSGDVHLGVQSRRHLRGRMSRDGADLRQPLRGGQR